MSGIQLAADTVARMPLRLLAKVLAAGCALVGGLVLVTWYGVVVPVLWLLVGVPATTVIAAATARQHSRGHLGRRLRRQRSGWQSSRGYRFNQLRTTCRRVLRWGR